MREYLFRGKRLDNGEWVEGAFYKQLEFYGDPCENCVIITTTEDLGYDQALDYYDVDPETVGQYTGLKDMNERKIFEGDVIRIDYDCLSFDGETADRRVEQGVITYDAFGSVGIVVEMYRDTPVWSDFFNVVALTDRIEDWSFEVIGNIHDNPELLEVKA